MSLDVEVLGSALQYTIIKPELLLNQVLQNETPGTVYTVLCQLEYHPRLLCFLHVTD